MVGVSDFGTRELGSNPRCVYIKHCFSFFKCYNAEILISSSMALYKQQ